MCKNNLSRELEAMLKLTTIVIHGGFVCTAHFHSGSVSHSLVLHCLALILIGAHKHCLLNNICSA